MTFHGQILVVPVFITTVIMHYTGSERVCYIALLHMCMT